MKNFMLSSVLCILCIYVVTAQTGKVGINTTSPKAMFHVQDSSVLFSGPPGALPVTPGPPPMSGEGTRMMWYPDKAAFRAGRVSGTHWDIDSIGTHSVAFGVNAKSSGISTFVGGGQNNKASGHISFAGGGVNNAASGNSSVVMGGESNTASGSLSFTGGGFNNTASGNSSFVGGGQFNNASGDISFTGGGFSNTASGVYSFAGGGIGLLSRSHSEAVFGSYNTDYAPASTVAFNTNDRLFVIGNGTSTSNRSNAVTVLKNGNVGIGTSSPFRRLHVSTGSSGAPAQSSAVAVFESANNTYLNILSMSDEESGILFSLPGSSSHGGIIYNNGALPASMLFRTNGNTTRMTIRETGNVGINTTAPQAMLQIKDGSVLCTGPSGVLPVTPSPLPVSGAGTRMMWYPDKAAFRAGRVVGTHWDSESIGDYSVAFGYSTKSTGSASVVAGGSTNTASGISSVVSGGLANIASGDYSFVGGGVSNGPLGISSVVTGGHTNTASGYRSFVGGGYNNTASGDYSCVTSAIDNTSSGISSFVGGGFNNTASGARSFTGGGTGLLSRSYSEAVFGSYNTDYTPLSAGGFNSNDRLFVIGNGTTASNRSNAVTVLKNGNVGIGTQAPSHPLHMASGARCTSAGTWTNASDGRLKDNVTSIQYGLETVKTLRPVSYSMRTTGEQQIGFIAQEMVPIIPEIVSGHEGDPDQGEVLGLNYGNLTAVLVKAMQEQQEIIEKQQEIISSQQSRIMALETEVKKINSQLATRRTKAE